MEEEKITLDREAFKVLASDTRVSILKSLHRRRKTLTELSRQFGMSPSTIKEHMDSLSRAELVVQKDEGHKWKYYELTGRGRNIVVPSDTRILVVLAASIIGIFATVFDLARASFQSVSRGAEGLSQAIPAAAPVADKGVESGAEVLPVIAQTAFPYLHAILIVLFAVMLTMGISLKYRARQKINI